MPTGYTASIKDGISFKEFALGCARAFGACIEMRDDPHDKPIPEKFEELTYNQKQLEKTFAELDRLNKMSPIERNQKAIVEWSAEVAERERDVEKNWERIRLYKNMLQKVRGWMPPTEDHIEYKNFMVKQIEDSVGWDDSSDYYAENPVRRLSGEEWFNKRRESLMKDIEYHSKEQRAETKRNDGRNKWISELRRSLDE